MQLRKQERVSSLRLAQSHQDESIGAILGMFRKIVAAHNMKVLYQDLNVAGIERYGNRAVLLPLAQATLSGDFNDLDFRQYISFLTSCNLGPWKIQASDEDMYQVLFAEGVSMRGKYTDGGLKFGFFQTSQHEEEMCHNAGIDFKQHVWNAPLHVSEIANDKAALRRMNHTPGTFPVFEICITQDEVAGACEKALSQSSHVIIKIPDEASGDGMIVFTLEQDKNGWCKHFNSINQAVQTFWERFNPQGDVIVEPFYHPHTPCSVQWYVGFDGKVYPGFASLQKMKQDGKTHKANIVGLNIAVPHLPEAAIQQMWKKSETFVQQFAEMGWKGPIGFDFIVTQDGEVFMLECNGRVTASTYLFGVMIQLYERCNKQLIAALEMFDLPGDSDIDGFITLRQKLENEGLLFEHATGIIPFLTGLLPQKVGFIFVASDAQELETLMKKGESLLGIAHD